MANIIEVNREDLIKTKKNENIENIDLYDFKLSSLSREQIETADTIIFKDSNKLKYLKDRYNFSKSENFSQNTVINGN